MGLGPLTARLRAGERREPPGTGVTAPVGSVVFKKKEARRWENKHHPGHERREARGQPPGNKVL